MEAILELVKTLLGVSGRLPPFWLLLTAGARVPLLLLFPTIKGCRGLSTASTLPLMIGVLIVVLDMVEMLLIEGGARVFAVTIFDWYLDMGVVLVANLSKGSLRGTARIMSTLGSLTPN